MSQFYNPNRKEDWNYGGKRWRLSRSKIDLFKECPRCFYVDNKLGTKRPPGFPFNLNSAVDTLLKKEFDIYRAKGERHPLMKQYGVDAIPYVHKDLDVWRENFKGVRVLHAPTGFTVSGAIDDVWVNPDGELFIVDYKATSKDEKIEALDKDWHRGYKRQMEVYQWLLRQKGFKVSNTGYFVYANAGRDKKMFDGKLEFVLTLIAYVGDDSWIEGTLSSIKETLESEEIPPVGKDCDYCTYREYVGKKLMKKHQENNTPKVSGREEGEQVKSKKVSKNETGTLF